VRVTSPRTAGARARRVTPTSEIDGRTHLGEIYLSSLLRTQLRLALAVLLAVVVPAGGLPLLLLLAPQVGDIAVLGMPLSWGLLAFAAYPYLLLCGWLYVRRAEHNERAFAAMVEPGNREDTGP
jgi:hypothetical protein